MKFGMNQHKEDDMTLTPEEFAIWLKEFFQIAETDQLSKTQTKILRQHLSAVKTPTKPEKKLKVVSEVEKLKAELTKVKGERDQLEHELILEKIKKDPTPYIPQPHKQGPAIPSWPSPYIGDVPNPWPVYGTTADSELPPGVHFMDRSFDVSRSDLMNQPIACSTKQICLQFR